MLGEGAMANYVSVDGKGQLSTQTSMNAIAVVKLYNRLKLPIILSGGEGLGVKDAGNEAQLAKRDLIEMGIPEEVITIEDKSQTTQENARLSSTILRKTGYNHPILVTSASHLARSVNLFEKEGIAVIPMPSQYTEETDERSFFDFLPSTKGLTLVNQSLKEFLGRLQ